MTEGGQAQGGRAEALGALAGGVVSRDLDGPDGRILLGRLKRARVRRKRVRVAAGAALVAAVILVAVLVAPRLSTTPADFQSDAGTRATYASEGSTATASHEPGVTTYLLERGSLRVAAVDEEVVVQAGDDEVHATAGAEFVVVLEGRNASVEVLSGRVRLAHVPTPQPASRQPNEGKVEAVAAAPAPVVEVDADSVAPVGPTAVAPGDDAPSVDGAGERPLQAPAPAARKAARWVQLAKAKDYDNAYAALEKAAGAGAVRDRPAELLLAADVARLSGHGAKAVPYLKKVVNRHAKDRRAPLAAFTLGRLYLRRLGNPTAAAGAFRKARTLKPGGQLAADSLARECEAWSKAGNKAKARSLAEQYLRKWPEGRHAAAVKRYAGLP